MEIERQIYLLQEMLEIVEARIEDCEQLGKSKINGDYFKEDFIQLKEKIEEFL